MKVVAPNDKRSEVSVTMDVQHGLYVEGKWEDEAVNMTIDTGSSISLIKYDVLEKIGLDLSNVQPVSSYLQSVTGEKKQYVGSNYVVVSYW